MALVGVVEYSRRDFLESLPSGGVSFLEVVHVVYSSRCRRFYCNPAGVFALQILRVLLRRVKVEIGTRA